MAYRKFVNTDLMASTPIALCSIGPWRLIAPTVW